ncbi:hypothetical protein BDF14DRAFT_1808409, partial [Spinellus fusiger]
MDYIVDLNEFGVKIIAADTEYLKNIASSESSLMCPNADRKAKKNGMMCIILFRIELDFSILEQHRDELTNIIYALMLFLRAIKRLFVSISWPKNIKRLLSTSLMLIHLPLL